MNPISAVIVTVLGIVCALITVWWALRAERAYGGPPPADPAPPALAEPPWWEGADWWPSLSPDEREWVLRNLAEAGHPAADAALRQAAPPE